MTIELYPIAIDYIVDNSGKIKILEMQSIFSSNFERAKELTNIHPLEEIYKGVGRLYPSLELGLKPKETVERNSIRISKLPVIGPQAPQNILLLNRGLAPLLEFKGLFNAFCNTNKKLKTYVPPTQLITLSTLGTIDLEKLQAQRTLFKPFAMAKGKGISLLPESFTSEEQLQAYLKKTVIHSNAIVNDPSVRVLKAGSSEGELYPHQVFLLQNYLHQGPKSEPKSLPTIRIYASVIWDHAQKKLIIKIVSAAAYQHIRIDQDKDNDFTLENNRHIPYEVKKSEEIQLTVFLSDFFRTLIAGQHKINYRVWEQLAKQYIKEHQVLGAEARLNILAQFVNALHLEQKYLGNRLSHYQCFILNRFFECYKSKDDRIYAKTSFEDYLKMAVVNLNTSMAPYQGEMLNPIHSVMESYHSLSLFATGKSDSDAENVDLAPEFANTTKEHQLDKFTKSVLDHLSHEDISAFSACSTDTLDKVEKYARNFMP
jgi:hypothetical protein